MADVDKVSHDREAYDARTKEIVAVAARVFFKGDIDAAWEKYFAQLETRAAAGRSVVDPASPAIMWVRPKIRAK